MDPGLADTAASTDTKHGNNSSTYTKNGEKPPKTDKDPPLEDKTASNADSELSNMIPAPKTDEDPLLEDEITKNANSELNKTIPAPPEQSYASRKECYNSIQTWALNNGYAIAMARSYPFKGST
ncbi:hypothetical protein PtB15_1B324 [Puccinia triticina]|nr:hypothetical protein PtB15_1B324 [Puccinia triticina]